MSIQTIDMEFESKDHRSLFEAMSYADANDDVLTISFETDGERVRLEKTTSGKWLIDSVNQL